MQVLGCERRRAQGWARRHPRFWRLAGHSPDRPELCQILVYDPRILVQNISNVPRWVRRLRCAKDDEVLRKTGGDLPPVEGTNRWYLTKTVKVGMPTCPPLISAADLLLPCNRAREASTIQLAAMLTVLGNRLADEYCRYYWYPR